MLILYSIGKTHKEWYQLKVILFARNVVNTDEKKSEYGHSLRSVYLK